PSVARRSAAPQGEMVPELDRAGRRGRIGDGEPRSDRSQGMGGVEAESTIPHAGRSGEPDDPCDRFVADWTAGRPGQIEDYLEGTTETGRSALRLRLVEAELRLRFERGETPEPGEYADRFPGLEDWISQQLEQLLATRVGSSDPILTPPPPPVDDLA